MPIKIPNNLPAQKILEQESVPMIAEHDALKQDIRPMKIAILNLMPDKIQTETQLARLLGQSPLQIELTLIKVGSYQPKNTSPAHLLNFYRNWEELQDSYFDGLIITGSPVEKLPFAQVEYWHELTQIFEWSLSHVNKILAICWGAQAALHYFYGIDKYLLPQKRLGIYAHNVVRKHHYLVRGLNDHFLVPVSRYTEVRQSDIQKISHLQSLIEAQESGACLVNDDKTHYLYMFNHLEYDSSTLKQEYVRDLEKGKNDFAMPINYFPNDDVNLEPINSWRSGAHLLFRNWIDDVYRSTPFKLSQISARKSPKS